MTKKTNKTTSITRSAQLPQKAADPVPVYIAEFGESFFNSNEATLRCAKIYANAVKVDSRRRAEFEKYYPMIPSLTWVRFELVGSGQMHPSLLMDTSVKASRAQHLPIDMQKMLITEGVPVVTEDGSHLKLTLESMTDEQAKLVIDKRCVRSLGAQRALLETKKIKSKKAPVRRTPCPVKTSKTGVTISGQWDGSWLDFARLIGAEGILALVSQMSKLG